MNPQVVPFSFDLSSLVRHSVASLYSHLVTRPTGRALRIGIESQIGELGSACVSVLDFTQVVVLDYSCADEAVAKLILHYLGPDRPADAYFVARGLGEQHREPLETVLRRHGLALVAHLRDSGFVLLGDASNREKETWAALENARRADLAALTRELAHPAPAVRALLDGLANRRIALRYDGDGRYYALSSLLTVA